MPGEPEFRGAAKGRRLRIRILGQHVVRQPKPVVRPEAVWLRHWKTDWSEELYCGVRLIPTCGKRHLGDRDHKGAIRPRICGCFGVISLQILHLNIDYAHRIPNVAGGTVYSFSTPGSARLTRSPSPMSRSSFFSPGTSRNS